MKTNERKPYNGMKWETCLYQYRFRMEEDMNAEYPWGKHGWDGWLATIDNPCYKPDFAYLESGEHDPDNNETVLYRRIATNGIYNPDYYLWVSVGELREKYREMMTGWDFVDGKNVRKPWATCNRKTLIEWANKNLDAEEKTVRQYLDGEVYGFVIERKPLVSDEETEWDQRESCRSFYGSNPNENGMSDYFDTMEYVTADFIELQKREHDKIAKTAAFLESARD